jgi:hypothetical protein
MRPLQFFLALALISLMSPAISATAQEAAQAQGDAASAPLAAAPSGTEGVQEAAPEKTGRDAWPVASLLQIISDFSKDSAAATGRYGDSKTLFVITESEVLGVEGSETEGYAVTLDVPEAKKAEKPADAKIFRCRISVFPEAREIVDAVSGYKPGDTRDFVGRFVNEEGGTTLVFDCVDFEAARLYHERTAEKDQGAASDKPAAAETPAAPAPETPAAPAEPKAD